jgi:hypothetical protein
MDGSGKSLVIAARIGVDVLLKAKGCPACDAACPLCMKNRLGRLTLNNVRCRVLMASSKVVEQIR